MSASLLNRSQVNGAFAEQFVLTTQRMHIDDLAMRTVSNAASERYGWLSAVPGMVEQFDPRTVRQLRGKMLDVSNKDFGNAVELLVKDMRRDQSGTVEIRMRELAEAAVVHPWEMIVDLIKQGDTTALGSAYDGSTYFATSHSDGDSSVNNDVTASEVPALNVSSATAPTPEEAVDAILGVIGHMHTFQNDAGRYVNENARRFGVVYKPTGGFHAAMVAAVKANNLASGETNVIAASDYQIVPIPAPQLDWTAEFSVHRLDGPTKGFIVQEEVAPELTLWDENSDYYKDNKAFKVGVGWEGNTAYGQYLNACKALFS